MLCIVKRRTSSDTNFHTSYFYFLLYFILFFYYRILITNICTATCTWLRLTAINKEIRWRWRWRWWWCIWGYPVFQQQSSEWNFVVIVWWLRFVVAVETVWCLVLQRPASVHQTASKEAGRKVFRENFVSFFGRQSQEWHVSVVGRTGYTQNLRKLEPQLCPTFVTSFTIHRFPNLLICEHIDIDVQCIFIFNVCKIFYMVDICCCCYCFSSGAIVFLCRFYVFRAVFMQYHYGFTVLSAVCDWHIVFLSSGQIKIDNLTYFIITKPVFNIFCETN